MWVKMDTWDAETLREVARRIFILADLPPQILHQLQGALPIIHQVSLWFLCCSSFTFVHPLRLSSSP